MKKHSKHGVPFKRNHRVKTISGPHSPTPRLLRALLLHTFLFLISTCFLANGLCAATTVEDLTPQERIIGLYLYNILLFVDWPESAFQNRHEFKIGVFLPSGEKPVLESLLGRTLKGKPLTIERIHQIQDLTTDYHALFVRDCDDAAIAEILAKLHGVPCLTVSTMPGFARQGGMVAFVHLREQEPAVRTEKNLRSTKRFRINLNAVLSAGLKIRSRLLRISEIVGGMPDVLFLIP